MCRKELGPVYGVELIKTLPIGGGLMIQAMPSRDDLEQVRKLNERTAAGYECLLAHYRRERRETLGFLASLHNGVQASRLASDGGWSRMNLLTAENNINDFIAKIKQVER